MKNLRILMAIAIGLISIMALSACEDKDTIILPGAVQQNQMQVTGIATTKKSPDIAIAQIGVQTINKEVEPAVAENNRKAEAIISTLKQLGISEKDIKTVSFNIYPLKDYKNNDPNTIIGFQVDNTVSVTFRKLDIVGKGLQAAITTGANNIYGIEFTLADPEPVRNELRVLAIQDARKKAENMAQAAGIQLGKIISINESSATPIYRYAYDKAAAESAVPVQSGELYITVQVNIVYELL
ncbi:MAG: SIMPL domain-containing protein [bacterium]